MIKEIPKPLPTITEVLAERKKKNQKIKQATDDPNDYIAFERDPTLVYEVAERCGIPKLIARKLLKSFFAEIKNLILQGYEVKIQKLGIFYMGTYNASKKSKKRNIKVLGPKFIPSVWFKQRLSGRDI